MHDLIFTGHKSKICSSRSYFAGVAAGTHTFFLPLPVERAQFPHPTCCGLLVKSCFIEQWPSLVLSASLCLSVHASFESVVPRNYHSGGAVEVPRTRKAAAYLSKMHLPGKGLLIIRFADKASCIVPAKKSEINFKTSPSPHGKNHNVRRRRIMRRFFEKKIFRKLARCQTHPSNPPNQVRHARYVHLRFERASRVAIYDCCAVRCAWRASRGLHCHSAQAIARHLKSMSTSNRPLGSPAPLNGCCRGLTGRTAGLAQVLVHLPAR